MKWLHTLFNVFYYRIHLISPFSMAFHEIFYYDDMHHVKQVNMSVLMFKHTVCYRAEITLGAALLTFFMPMFPSYRNQSIDL